MLKKWLSVFMMGLILSLLLVGCSGSNDNAEQANATVSTESTESIGNITEDSSDTWTVFIYLCGTDLESEGGGQASGNLDELKGITYNDNVNIIVQTGGTKQWHTPEIDPNHLQRWYMSNNGMELLEEHDLTSMGDPQTLYDFLSWGIKAYPADKTGVIFWNHGGGTLDGAEFDELFNGDSLTLSEMGQTMMALSEEMSAPFEMVGFDTCLMATLENAYLWAPFANYLVSSAEVEPGGGWDYLEWGQYLSDNPNATGAELGGVICDTYYKKCESSGTEAFATLSVVDLSMVSPLVAAFDTISGDLDVNISDMEYFSGIVRSVSASKSYGANSPGEGFTNQIDLGHLAIHLNNNVGVEAEALVSALDAAVIYQVAGSIHASSSGMSVYFPMEVTESDLDSLAGHYNDVAPSASYKSFIDQALGNKSEALQSEEELIVIAEEPFLDDDGIYQFTIDPSSLNNIESVTFNLYLEGEEDYLYLGNDNDLIMDWETGHVMDNFRGVWPTLNGYYVSFYIVDEQDDYILYSIPIMLNGEQTNLRVMWIWDEEEGDTEAGGEFVVLGAWSGIDDETGMSSRDIELIYSGDEIVPLYLIEDGDTGEYEWISGDPFLVEDYILVEESELFEGNYWYNFIITDVYGNSVETDYAVITIDENGDMTIEA